MEEALIPEITGLSGAMDTGSVLTNSGTLHEVLGATFGSQVLNYISSPENWISLLVYFLIFLWIMALVRVIRDATARSNSLGFQIVSLLMVLFLTPLIGLPIYWAVRPKSFKKDQLPRRESLLMNVVACSNCDSANKVENTCCTECGERLHTTCRECNASFSSSHQYCEYCGAPNIEISK